jgi:hypothetical protein
MPIEFACESCARLLRVPDGSGGMLCECPACRAQLTIPDPDAVGIVESAENSQTDDQQVRMECPKCQQSLICSRKLLGTKGQCRHCQYIFVISESGTAQAAPVSEWLFNCPKCDQLFEGQPEMRGRKGKCHNCGEVFAIELKRASEQLTEVRQASAGGVGKHQSGPPASASVSPAGSNKSTKPTGPISPGPKSPGPKSPGPISPAEKTAAPKPGPGPGPPQVAAPKAALLPPIQLTCTGCRGVMEVPGEAAGQTTACPFCQKLLKIPQPSPQFPSPALPGAAAARPSRPAGKKPAWNTGGPDATQPAGGGRRSGLGVDLRGMSNKVPDMDSPDLTSPRGGFLPYKGQGSPANSGGTDKYFIPGILICAFAVIEALSVCVLGLLQSIQSVPAMENQGESLASTQQAIAVVLAISAVAMVVLIIKFFGGLAMARRSSLAMARTSAILSCLPCFCMFASLPVGIWGIVLTFSSQARRDF